MSRGFVRIKHLDTLYVYCRIIPLVLLLSLLLLLLLILLLLLVVVFVFN